MTKTATVSVIVLVGITVICVTVLAALEKDLSAVITFLTTGALPTIASLFAVNQASKARTAAETTVNNTNGRMRQLIAIIENSGQEVPDGYEDLREDEPSIRG